MKNKSDRTSLLLSKKTAFLKLIKKEKIVSAQEVFEKLFPNKEFHFSIKHFGVLCPKKLKEILPIKFEPGIVIIKGRNMKKPAVFVTEIN